MAEVERGLDDDQVPSRQDEDDDDEIDNDGGGRRLEDEPNEYIVEGSSVDIAVFRLVS